MGFQPTLHNAEILLAAPTLSVTSHDVVTDGADGIWHSDVRVATRLHLDIDGLVDDLGARSLRADHSEHVLIIRGVGEPTPDPVIRLRSERTVKPGWVHDRHTLTNSGSFPIALAARVGLEVDTASLDDIKAGRTPVPSVVNLSGFEATWEGNGVKAMLRASIGLASDTTIEIAPGGEVVVEWTLTAETIDVPAFAAVTDPSRYLPDIAASGQLGQLLAQSVDDLRGLMLCEPQHPEDVFLAAGAPWYLTLFGRDALWAATFTLPAGIGLAMGTLRVLARRQGAVTDADSEEAPGKILHEVRAGHQLLDGGVVLPPTYFGSVDATALWCRLLVEVWRAGAPTDQVAELLPNLTAALDWIESSAAETGFLRYVDSSGNGLSNQGWKDSPDGIRRHDGSLPSAPIALCEVQAYAYAAATEGASLLEEFGISGAHHRSWAEDLKARFAQAYWVEQDGRRYPAIALDGRGRPVAALTSNIGHLLGTGILQAGEARQIADLVLSPELNSGFGLRTMSCRAAGYNPIGYHTGSVWTHDTVIAARGLHQEGLLDEAQTLILGVLAAAPAFDYRLPELYGGFPAIDREGRTTRPVPYAASCHPQAWAAAAAIQIANLAAPAPITG